MWSARRKISIPVLILLTTWILVADGKGNPKLLKTINKKGVNDSREFVTMPNPTSMNLEQAAEENDSVATSTRLDENRQAQDSDINILKRLKDIPEIRTILVHPPRYPRRAKEETRLRRLRIRDRKTGFDGMVQRIQIEPEEGKPGASANDMPKKQLENDVHVEKVPMEEMPQENGDTRNERLVQAYGMSKKQLDENGYIERVPVIVTYKDEDPQDAEPRPKRSISGQSENELDDLEAQDAKVFRPLFVYRQQVAARERRNRKKQLAANDPRRFTRRPDYHDPHAYRRPYHY